MTAGAAGMRAPAASTRSPQTRGAPPPQRSSSSAWPLGVGAPGLDLKPPVDGPASASRAIVEVGIRSFPANPLEDGQKSGVPASQSCADPEG